MIQLTLRILLTYFVLSCFYSFKPDVIKMQWLLASDSLIKEANLCCRNKILFIYWVSLLNKNKSKCRFYCFTCRFNCCTLKKWVSNNKSQHTNKKNWECTWKKSLGAQSRKLATLKERNWKAKWLWQQNLIWSAKSMQKAMNLHVKNFQFRMLNIIEVHMQSSISFHWDGKKLSSVPERLAPIKHCIE